jgi:DNA helicase-2/ATP-dependent DNA helicase PcrA
MNTQWPSPLMPEIAQLSQAEQAADEALQRVFSAVRDGRSFVLEAGAGAGKTHSLVRVLKYLIVTRGAELVRHRQRVACITYTNVAKEEIESRTDRDPVIYCGTIHAFCWSLLKDFQLQLRQRLPEIEKWKERLEEAGGVGLRSVEYNLGYRAVDVATVSLHHDDVMELFAQMVQLPKFRAILAARFPFLLIDEYQDMNGAFAHALKEQFLGSETPVLFGFFGDHWQKIYQDVCGRIDHPALVRINEGANFRSVKVIVDVLNRMRPELPQAVVDPEAAGSVGVYLTNDWTGKRLSGSQWKGDLPPGPKQRYMDAVKAILLANGWRLDPGSTKILLLTHKALAAEQGYEGLANAFPYSSDYIDKQNKHIKFFADVLEPVCGAYVENRFAEMFSILGVRIPAVRSSSEKREWSESMQQLLDLRDTGTVGDVLDHLHRAQHPRLPEELEDLDRSLRNFDRKPEDEEQPELTVLRNLRGVPYCEVTRLVHYLEGDTPFSTKHGVKGAEFESVLVIVGMGWNRYNFNQMLEWAADGEAIPQEKWDAFERARNLFYVCCSRPRRRLAVLFTQELSHRALSTLERWFGKASLRSLGNL